MKDTVREPLEAPVTVEHDGSVPSQRDYRSGRSEMVVVIGFVALASMIFGFVLGLLF